MMVAGKALQIHLIGKFPRRFFPSIHDSDDISVDSRVRVLSEHLSSYLNLPITCQADS